MLNIVEKLVVKLADFSQNSAEEFSAACQFLLTRPTRKLLLSALEDNSCLDSCSQMLAAGDVPASSLAELMDRHNLADIHRCVGITRLHASMSSLFGRMDEEYYWLHTITAAETYLLLKRYSAADGKEVQSKIYLACLLHDFGLVLLSNYFSSFYDQVIALSNQKNLFIEEAEKAVYKTEHGEVGASILEHLGLPLEVTAPIRHHHLVQKASPAQLRAAKILHLADALSNFLNPGEGTMVTNTIFYDTAWDDYLLDIEQVPQILEQLNITYQRTQHAVKVLQAKR